MRGVIFTQTLRRNWQQVFTWGLGIATIAIFILALLPDIEALQQMARLIASLPVQMVQAFGVQDVAQLTTAEGFISFSYFSYVILIMSAYAVVAGLNVSAVEEDQGILDMLLSAPVSRAQLVIEKCLAYVVLMIAIILMTYTGFLIGSAFTTMSLDMGLLFAGTLNMIPSTLLVFGFAMLMGALLRRREIALGISVAFIIVSYFIEFIGNSASDTALAALRAVSYYNYYGSENLVVTGVQLGNVVLLIVVGVALFAGGLVLFQRRDIGL